jgi:hypothetical protein
MMSLTLPDLCEFVQVCRLPVWLPLGLCALRGVKAANPASVTPMIISFIKISSVLLDYL